jgi:FMN phosphatase YigB (HAD superfamily)
MGPPQMIGRKLLVCDLDNTLYDWVGYFVPSLYAMIDVAVEIIGCDRERILDDLRRVHQRHHDSEQPFALLETDVVQERFRGIPTDEIAAALDPAFHAFNSARKRNLRLSPGVQATLTSLNRSGIAMVAHTESRLYGAVDRLTRLNIMNFFQRVYCRERSVTIHPDKRVAERWFASVPLEKIRELSHHQMKPDPAVLLEICDAEGFHPEQSAYVGDSIARDMLMAKRAGLFAIWAAYGAAHDPEKYDALVRISHWTSDEVTRELELRREAKCIQPDYIARTSFAEVVPALESELHHESVP